MDTGCRIRRVDDVPFQSLMDQTVIVDPLTRSVHVLNETASRIWCLLERARVLGEVVALLRDEFAFEQGTEAEEIESFLNELADKKLITFLPSTS